MQGNIITYRISPLDSFSNYDKPCGYRTSSIFLRSVPGNRLHLTLRLRYPSICGNIANLPSPKSRSIVKNLLIKSVTDVNQGYLPNEDDDELCPVECVREFKSDEEFVNILEKAKKTNSLVVVDFYRTSCGSCKYIEQGFSKLCKASGDEDVPVIFLKHNVLDEYDEQSEVADRLRIKTVPLFHFYKDGKLLEAFPTRDKERITEAIFRYMSPAPQDV